MFRISGAIAPSRAWRYVWRLLAPQHGVSPLWAGLQTTSHSSLSLDALRKPPSLEHVPQKTKL